jgi:hypothetical protein
VFPVMYELGFYIPEDDILHSHCCEDLKSYIVLTGRALWRRRNVSPLRYELGLYIPEDSILHSHRREDLKSYVGWSIPSDILTSKRLFRRVRRALAPTCIFPPVMAVQSIQSTGHTFLSRIMLNCGRHAGRDRCTQASV